MLLRLHSTSFEFYPDALIPICSSTASAPIALRLPCSASRHCSDRGQSIADALGKGPRRTIPRRTGPDVDKFRKRWRSEAATSAMTEERSSWSSRNYRSPITTSMTTLEGHSAARPVGPKFKCRGMDAIARQRFFAMVRQYQHLVMVGLLTVDVV